jgi:CHAT domain-containing protein/tetratricopeptide (TPR) repeat protein
VRLLLLVPLAFLAAATPDSSAPTAGVRGQAVLDAIERGDLAAAERELETLASGSRVEDPAGRQLADDLSDLATVRSWRGDAAGAAEAWRESIAVLDLLDPPTTAPSRVARLDALAEAERRLGRYDEAERLLREAISVSEAHLPRNSAHARLLNNLGALLWDEVRHDEAAALLREALRISEADPEAEPDRIPVARHNLANLLREQGRLEEAESLHEGALALARTPLAGDARLAVFLEEAAVVKGELGKHDEAAALFAEALDVAEALGDPLERAEILLERGRERAAAGQEDAAREDLERCLAIRERELGPDHPATGQALAEVGIARADAAALERALAILARTPAYPQERIGTCAALARLDAEAGRRPDAIVRHLATLALADSLRAYRTASEAGRAEWARRVADVADETITWLVEEGRVAEAIAVGEGLRARVLADQMRSASVDWRTGIPAEQREELAAREREARASVARARRALEAAGGVDGGELERAIDAWRDVEEEIRVASPEWRRALSDPRDDALAAVQASLGGAECVLVWHVGREASHGFVVTRTRVRAWRLQVEPEIAAAWGIVPGDLGDDVLERVLREGVATVGGEASGLLAPRRGLGRLAPSEPREAPPLGERQRELERVADVLLPPGLRKAALGAERVVVVPDGPLHRLPFEALVLGTGSGGAIYWLDEGPVIVYAHSLQTLAALDRRPDPSGGPALSVANPALGTPEGRRASLGPLPGTERESEAFSRAFAGLGVVTLAGAEAREGAVKSQLAGASVIHLGTHGIVEQDRDELLAALVLAPEPPGSEEDGYLHLFEVYELRLAAEVVVLSACDTRLGRRVRGEGVFALSRGFLAAGAARAVASLWSVNDDATAAVMTGLFERAADPARRPASRPFRPGEVDWALALRDAKRAVREQERWADPFFWAPFVTSGVHR